MASINEYSMSVDDFKNPKTYSDREAVCVLLARLLLLEPGTFQSHPNMGVGLVSKYRYGVDVASDLQSNFKNQIELYLPQLQGCRVNVTQSGQVLNIAVEYNNVLYGVSFNQSSNKISTNSASLAAL